MGSERQQDQNEEAEQANNRSTEAEDVTPVSMPVPHDQKCFCQLPAMVNFEVEKWLPWSLGKLQLPDAGVVSRKFVVTWNIQLHPKT